MLNGKEASSINFRRSVEYGFVVLATSPLFRLHFWGIATSSLFHPHAGKLLNDCYQKVGEPSEFVGRHG
jgi:hypothetical protein